MKQFLFWTLATLLCCMTASAQTVGVAVLTHGGSNTMFYGNTALQQAADAATEGDVISLSPGVFNGLDNHSKSGLTIIGSGMNEGPSQTILTGFSLRANDNPEKFVKLTLKNVYIKDGFRADYGNYELYLAKCRVFQSFQCSIAETESSTIEMVNCVSEGSEDNFRNCRLNAYNCVLLPTDLTGDVSRDRILTNCILCRTPNENSSGSIHSCIIIDGYPYCLPSSVRATYCKAIVKNGDYLGLQTLSNERLDFNFEAFVEGSFYELKPELATTWVDENGEQIGLYGGPEPFNPLPDAPRFTKFNVPTRTDSDGKLPIEIAVEMPEK